MLLRISLCLQGSWHILSVAEFYWPNWTERTVTAFRMCALAARWIFKVPAGYREQFLPNFYDFTIYIPSLFYDSLRFHQQTIDETWACCRNSGTFDVLLFHGFLSVYSDSLTCLVNSVNQVGKVTEDLGSKSIYFFLELCENIESEVC
jgi:hypothetical protein